MMSIKGLSVAFGDRVILDQLCMDIPEASITALVGQNGAGKSTLFKAMTSQNEHQSVFIDGKPLHAIAHKELAKRRSVLSQELHLSFNFTALDVALMGRMPYYRSFESPQDKAIAQKWLERFDALHLQDRLYPTLSGGEKQRVQLARVLSQIDNDLPCTKYLFLDEPSGHLDLWHEFLMLEVLDELAKNGIGVFIILHNLSLCYQFAHRTALLHEGRIQAYGKTPNTLTPELIRRIFHTNAQITTINDQPRLIITGRLVP